MKDRIVFFALGAILATLAYFVGNINISVANDPLESKVDYDRLRVKELIVDRIFATNSIYLIDSDNKVFGISFENSNIVMQMLNMHNAISIDVTPEVARLILTSGGESGSSAIFSVSNKRKSSLIYLKDSIATKIISSHDVNVE